MNGWRLNNVLWAVVILLMVGVTACGYRFPGDRSVTAAAWKNTVLRVEGEGARQDPRLAFILGERLNSRLGIPAARAEDQGANQGGTPDNTKSKTQGSDVLRIMLDAPRRDLISEDQGGRADQYRVVIQARPVVAGRENAPRFPAIKGTAFYYEPRAGASIQTIRMRAESEALDQLTDGLAAVLAGDF